MIERVDVVSHGRPATRALAACVEAAKRSGALAPVTVIVGSNLAGLAARRLLAAGAVGPGGLANVSFVTPFRLAELLSSDRLTGLRPLTNPVLGSAVRRSLAHDAGPFAAVADHLATERAVAALYGELSNVSPATLDVLAAAGGTAAAAVAQHRSVRSHLGAFHDEADVADAAADRPDLASALGPFGHLVWYVPEPVTPALGRFLAAVLGAAPASAVVALTGNAGADQAVRAVCQRVGVPIDDRAAAAIEVPRASHIVSVTDPDEEVRAVVRQIADLAASGVALHRVGVFCPTADPYLRTLRQQLDEAGMPANGPSRDRLADRVAGRTLLAALALPGERWRRDRVLSLVSGAPVRVGGAAADAASWELLSRRAGVVAELGDWRRKLAALADRLRRELERADGSSPAAAAIARDLDRLDGLVQFVEATAAAVRAVDAAGTWAAKCAAAGALLEQLLGPHAVRLRWPDDEQEAAQRTEAALARLAALDELEPDPTPAVFRRALAAELDVRRGRQGRSGYGVSYGPLSAAVGQDLDAVFVLGMAEGSCPAPRRDDALLPDSVRQLAGGELALHATALHDQHRWYLAALASAPPSRRWLVHPRGDLRGGRRRLPSRWLLDTASALAGARVPSTDFADLADPVVHVVPSFAAGLVDAPAAASVVERDLAVLAGHLAAGGDPALHPAAEPVRRGLQAMRDRRSRAFTPWDGNLAAGSVPSPAGDVVRSATGLERWAACGFRYLLSDVLGVGQRDDPERVLELSPADRGSLVHEVLERFFAQVIADGAPEPDRPWSAEDRQRLEDLTSEVFARWEAEGKTGRPVRWRLQQTQVRALLDEFLTADDEHRSAAGARPFRVEMAFGGDGADPVVVELADGRQVRFRGVADRVDAAAGDRYLVLDYKTGKGDKYRRLDDDPVLAGTTLQLGLYAEAARQLLGARSASGHYWVLRDGDCGTRHGYEWTDERRQRFVEAITTIVDGISAGTFAADPGPWNAFRRTHEHCTHCPYDRLCPVERGEHAAAKAGATELAPRRALALRSLDDDDEVGP